MSLKLGLKIYTEVVIRPMLLYSVEEKWVLRKKDERQQPEKAEMGKLGLLTESPKFDKF